MRNQAAALNPTFWPAIPSGSAIALQLQRNKSSAPHYLRPAQHIVIPKAADSLRTLQIKAGTI